MTTELSNFAARLREHICSFFDVGDDVRSLIFQNRQSAIGNRQLSEPPHVGSYEKDFNRLALELFALQFKHNAACRKICEARHLTPGIVKHWTQIPAVPTAAFKELELTSLAPAERTVVFHSSGTTEQKPSRHHHNAASLAVYETSLWSWFHANVTIGAPNSASAQTTPDEKHVDSDQPSLRSFGAAGIGAPATRQFQLVILTPPPTQAPHSSLVHMFETVRQKLGGASVPASRSAFFGKVAADGSWTLDFDAVLAAMSNSTLNLQPSTVILGTAFSFVHLLDFLGENNLSFQLPPGSQVMETGGYKNRSRSMPKTDLHHLITERLGIPPSHIICEYGMSELSSQAYDLGALASRRRVSSLSSEQDAGVTPALPGLATRHFRFPPWARVQIISPETCREVADGETGLIRIFDLANIFSVMAVQTEDLGIRRGENFELIGRAALAEPRGCSLMMLEGSASSLPQLKTPIKMGIDEAMPSNK